MTHFRVKYSMMIMTGGKAWFVDGSGKFETEAAAFAYARVAVNKKGGGMPTESFGIFEVDGKKWKKVDELYRSSR